MIIKYTLKDNDFTQVIEQYLEEYSPFSAIFYKSLTQHIEFKKNVARYDDLKNNTMEKKKLKKTLTQVIKDKFHAYMNNIEFIENWKTDGYTKEELIQHRPYILNNIKIEIVNSIKDTWQNGEVVYYFTSNMKYLTM